MDGGETGLPSLLLQAAQSAAQADGLPTPADNNSQNLGLDHAVNASNAAQNRKGGGMGGGAGKKKGPPLRRGKWTAEEEAYANRLIQEFKAGLLPLTDGTTLRTFLSKLLNCDPMRISKKFVGSNCIGKQVFRRRTADINRLTPEQIQQSRAELSELERRFLERVAQTNRVKSSGVGGGAGAAPSSAPANASGLGGVTGKPKDDYATEASPPSPPWLQPPLGYRQGAGASMAASNLSGGESNSRAAAAGRALLQGLSSSSQKNMKDRNKQGSNNPFSSHESAGLLAMAELQRRASQQRLSTNSFSGSSAGNLLAAAAAARNGSNSALAQIARNASTARLTAGGNSMSNLMMKTGLSRDQLSQLARDRGLSSASLSNMMERQNSFDALMSLDFQSLQSIDNLANLIQTGGAGQVPEGGMKNWSADAGLGSSRSNLAAAVGGSSSGNLSSAARRLASAGRMESFLRSLSSQQNLGNKDAGSNDHNNLGGGNSNANFTNLLQSMQSNLNNLGNNNNSSSNFFNANRNNNDGNGGNSASAASLANLLRGGDSSTGLTALRLQEGLNQRNTSVDDFLSLVTAGDIPHQDPSLLNIPLNMQQQGGGGGESRNAAALLAQRQMLAQAAQSRSFSNFTNASSGNLNSSSSASALMAAAQDRNISSNELKRKLLEMQGFGGEEQSSKKR